VLGPKKKTRAQLGRCDTRLVSIQTEQKQRRRLSLLAGSIALAASLLAVALGLLPKAVADWLLLVYAIVLMTGFAVRWLLLLNRYERALRFYASLSPSEGDSLCDVGYTARQALHH
jgi:hypothetical protein